MLVFNWNAPRRSSLFVVAIIWLFVILSIAFPLAIHRDLELVTYNDLDGSQYQVPQYFYGNTGRWCWINNNHFRGEGIGLEYFWLWLATVVDTLVYVFLALYFGGFVVVDNGRHMRFTSKQERTLKAEREQALGVVTNANAAARRMLL